MGAGSGASERRHKAPSPSGSSTYGSVGDGDLARDGRARERRAPMKDCRQFYIDGKWVAPTTPNDFPVTNPANEDHVAVISLGTAADVDKAVKAARRAFETFSETTREERLDLLNRII